MIAGAGGGVAAGTFLSLLLFAVQAQEIDRAEPTGRAAQQPCTPRDGAGPEMVVIAAGEFRMGSPESEQGRWEQESPQHPVTLTKPFALGRCEVSVGEFRRFVEATGYRTHAERSGGCYVWDESQQQFIQDPSYHWRNPGFDQTDRHPVVCVSRQDAESYIAWLNDTLGLDRDQAYRLPSEAEWEFAARAGTTTAYYWGDASQCDHANGLDASARASGDFTGNYDYADCEDGFVYTSPVASFAANPWGLYDMSGNVWEFVADCWHDSYQGAPNDGSAWLETGNDSCMPVVRGGGWFIKPRNLRAAVRFWSSADGRIFNGGFRLARTL